VKKQNKTFAVENWRLQRIESTTQMPFLVSLAFAADIQSHAKILILTFAVDIDRR